MLDRWAVPKGPTLDPGARHQPTWALIDVDPGSAGTFDDVLVLALLYRTALGHLGVEAMPKVTG